MKVLITGSSGFVGCSLKKKLEKRGVEVVSYDLDDNPPNNIKDFLNLKSKVEGVDGVVHLAALSQPKLTRQDPLNCVNINIGGTANVLEAIRQAHGKRPWVIFSSSREVFGEAEVLPVTEKTPRRPMTIYGLTKRAGEDLCRVFSQDYGLKTRVVCFTSVYSGKDDDLNRIVPKFIIQAVKNEPLIINGTGEEIFDFTYIDDATEGIWNCIKELEGSQKLYDDFIISASQPVFLKDLAKIVIEETKSKSEIRYAPVQSYSTTRCYADCRKAKEIIGFVPKTNIKEGIKLVVKEFKEAKIIN
mgnify:CR=1 FL=1